MPDIVPVLLRQANPADIRVDRCDTPAAEIRPEHQKSLLNLQRHRPQKRILFQTHIIIHTHGNPLLDQLPFKLLPDMPHDLLKGRRICKHMPRLNPSEKFPIDCDGK